MRTEIIELTPELAAEWLANAATNRHPSPKSVSAMARDIAEERWTLNGESVKLNPAGQMFDGKHRCTAVVQAGRSIRTVVVFDADEMNVDMGRPRSYGDVLTMAGYANGRNLAGLITLITGWKRGLRPGFTQRVKFTLAERDKVLADHPEIEDAYREAARVAKDVLAPRAVIGLCIWLFDRIDPTVSREFLRDVATGVQLEEGNAALALRNRLQREAHTQRRSLGDRDAAALFILAWNGYRDRRPMSKLQLPNPLTNDSFPEPK